MKKYDIAVIGGGASGLAAAISAKRAAEKLNIAVIERLPRVGKKLLSTGNGRCNFSNRNITGENYFGSCKELFRLCEKYPAEEFFSSMGVVPYADECGRVYPNSNAASSVLDALRIEASALGIETLCDTEVTGIKEGFVIRSAESAVNARKVIIAGGGCSQPSLGSNGSMLSICRDMGLKIREPFPVLAPLKTEPKLIGALKGQRVAAKASLYIGGSEAASERGEVQFSDGVISGICVFDLSCLKGAESSELMLDLLPDTDTDEVYALFSDIRKKRAGAPLEDMLSGVFNKRVGMYILKKCTDKPLSEACSALSNDEIRRLAETAKALRFPIKGVCGFEKSQATGGGVIRAEIDDDLQSLKVSGLYLCGEILDIHAKCGGFNLAFAFASGQHAGRCCALSF